MSDLLRERLQAQVQDVPVRARGAATVRRDAEAGRRRRRAAAATLVAVLALVVGTGALLGATGGRLTGPPAEQTPAPTGGPEVRAAFLAVAQLPVGTWIGSEAAERGDSPICLGQWPEATVAARRFTSAEPDEEGFQTVLTFPSADDAQSAVATAAFTVFACPKVSEPRHPDSRTGLGGGSGYLTRLTGTTAQPRQDVVVYDQAGRFVSLLWLELPGTTPVGSERAADLARAMGAALRTATDRLPRPAPTGLAAAMLVPADLPPGVSGTDPSLDLRFDPFAYRPLHSCDVDAAHGLPQRQVVYSGRDPGAARLGQRVSVAADPGQAQSVFAALEAGARGCRDVDGDGSREAHPGDDLQLAGIGDDAAGWAYEIRWPAPSEGSVTHGYVAVVRSGRAVMQVAWEGLSDGVELAPAQFEAVVRAASDRLVSDLPDVADPTASTTGG